MTPPHVCFDFPQQSLRPPSSNLLLLRLPQLCRPTGVLRPKASESSWTLSLPRYPMVQPHPRALHTSRVCLLFSILPPWPGGSQHLPPQSPSDVLAGLPKPTLTPPLATLHTAALCVTLLLQPAVTPIPPWPTRPSVKWPWWLSSSLRPSSCLSTQLQPRWPSF